MLPMLFVPGPQGEIVPREFSLRTVLPAQQETYAIVRPWAVEFWARVVADRTISNEFRTLANDAMQQVSNAS
jgi:hypothetical protein